MGSENTVGKMLTNGGGLKIPLKTFFAMNSELEIFFNEISPLKGPTREFGNFAQNVGPGGGDFAVGYGYG